MDTDKIVGLDDADSLREMRKRHIAMAIRMQSVASTALAELEAKIADGKPLNMSAADAKALLDSGRRLEQAALGETEPDDDAPSPKKPAN
jgi:hypothetical protein